MDKIFKIINCCSREEIQNTSELNVKIDNSQENNQSFINSKLEEKDKSLEIKNEPLIIKPTESNIINDIINEKKEIHNNNNNKIEEKKNESNDNKNKEPSNKDNKKHKSKNKQNKEKSKKRNSMTIENQNKILSNIFRYKSSSRKDIKKLPFRRDSALTLNDLELNVKSQDEIQENGSKLLMTGELFFYKELIIQTNGLKQSRRKEKDEHVFFGLKKKKNSSLCFRYNDFIINYVPSEESEIIETKTGRVFEIYNNKISKDYTLKFLHPNLILYYKISNYLYFNTGKEYYLLLGNIFVTINVIKSTPMEKSIIIQIENENNSYSFSQNQTPIKIGRSCNNDLPIYSQTISKKHGIIEFSNNLQSFYYMDLGSTNSSTLLIKEEDNLKIKGIMNFKLEDTPFRIQEIP